MRLPWPFSPDDREKSARYGTVSPIDIEIHDSVNGWYYFGRVEMFEKEYEFLSDLGHGKPPEKRKLFFYRLLTTYKEDERIIVSDEDMVHNGDQIPYTRTRKGHDRLFQVVLITFGFIYGLTLYLAALFAQAGPSVAYYSQQVANLELGIGLVAGNFAAAAIMWAVNARYHHFVGDWEIQPLRIDSVHVSTDFYVLTNSSKVPVYPTVLRLAKLDKPAVDTMVAAVRSFEKNELDKLQEMLKSTRQQLEVTEIQATSQYLDNKEAAMMVQHTKSREPMDAVRIAVAFAGIAITAFVLGMLVFLGGM